MVGREGGRVVGGVGWNKRELIISLAVKRESEREGRVHGGSIIMGVGRGGGDVHLHQT
jgi:hypothetical protein